MLGQRKIATHARTHARTLSGSLSIFAATEYFCRYKGALRPWLSHGRDAPFF